MSNYHAFWQGAEATIAYTELAATRPERRAALLTNYHFDIDAGQVRSARQGYVADSLKSTVAEDGWGWQDGSSDRPLAKSSLSDRETLQVYQQPPMPIVGAAEEAMTAVQPGTGDCIFPPAELCITG
jgi:hypothetical protein